MKLALFASSRNRRKDKKKKKKGRKKKFNWFRPEQQELLVQFSNTKMLFYRKMCLIQSI